MRLPWTPTHFRRVPKRAVAGSQEGIVASLPGTIGALLEAGADPNARDHQTGGTTLHVAAALSETPDVIEALLDAGADPNARNEAGRRPFEVVPGDAPWRGTAAFRRLKNAESEGP